MKPIKDIINSINKKPKKNGFTCIYWTNTTISIIKYKKTAKTIEISDCIYNSLDEEKDAIQNLNSILKKVDENQKLPQL